MSLVSIAEFSRRSRLSPKAPRLYDNLGLLVPDHVDAATGYRWHADTQLEQARVVALLRRTGVPLAQIRGSGDSDGPVEFCWPVPSDQAAEIAAKFPDLTLRTEPTHQEAFVGQGKPGVWDSEAEVAIESLIAWASEQQRRPSGGVRMLLVFNPASKGAGPDCEFALALC